MSVQYKALVKLGWVNVSASDDEVYPDNIGALQLGLQALAKQRAEDFARSEQLWAQAKALLAEESEDEVGAGASGAVQVADDFNMACLTGDDYGYGGFYRQWVTQTQSTQS